MDDRRRPWLMRAQPLPLVVAFALGAAVVGGAAAADHLVTGADVKNGSLTGADIRNGNLTGTDIKNGSVRRADLAPALRASLRGAAGPAGAPGPTGPRGPEGPSSVPSPLSAAMPGIVDLNVTTTQVLTLDVPAGRYMVLAAITIGVEPGDTAECTLLNGATELNNPWTHNPTGLTQSIDFNLQAITAGDVSSLRVTCRSNGSALAQKGVIHAIPVN